MSTFLKLSDSWDTLGDDEKLALFEKTTYEAPSTDDISGFSSPVRLATYGATGEAVSYHLTGVPVDQAVLPLGLISMKSYAKIDSVAITASVTGSSSIHIAVTNDGTTYQTYDTTSGSWAELDVTDKAAFLARGIPVENVSSIDADAWAAINTTEGIGFAYPLHQEAESDTCATDALVLTVDMDGSWNHAVHGTDYTYGYPNNALLQVELLSNGDYKINYNAGEAAKKS